MSIPIVPCSMDAEDTFGPAITRACLEGFDFTLLFEETILSALPLGLVIIWCGLCMPWNGPIKVCKSWHLTSKLLAYGTHTALQIVLVALWARPNTPVTTATLPTTALTVGGFVLLMFISYTEHVRSVRPSTPLTIYLGLSLLLDLARVRTLFYIPANLLQASVFLASFVVKIAIFLLELVEKRKLLKPAWRCASTEATASVYNRSLFIWLNGLFFTGFRSHLSLESLTPIDPEILAAAQPTSLIERWDRADKTKPYALLRTFILHYRYQLLAGVLPRLASIGFSFAQPLLIDRALDFTALESKQRNSAYGLIAAYGIVYIGMAISLAVYEHKTYRALTMFRGSLITLIYDRTLGISSAAIPDAEAITLMSADIDRIGGSFHFLHEFYACLIELALALWLIYSYLGVAMAAPTAFVALCTILGVPIATIAGDAQVQWLEAIEVRLTATTMWLRHIKELRMAGLIGYSSSIVANFRSAEVASSRRYRILTILINLGSTVSSTFSPLWGFGVYILLAKSRNSETLTPGVAFATLSLLELQDQPAGTIVDAFEHFQILYRCFERIQEHLLAQGWQDLRLHDRSEQPKGDMRGTAPQAAKQEKQLVSDQTPVIASVTNVSVSYTNDSPTLRDLNFDITQGCVTVVIGPVGSGKSTLLNLLLGEIPTLQGSIYTSFSSAAFCQQSPWITCGSIRDNILGLSSMVDSWYREVVDACALSADFKDLVGGDETQTGTRGARLSGGQKMRISLARALYSRNPVLILDDVLAGLDRVTERSILDAVFGPSGLIKQSKASVVLATHSAHHSRYADHLIVLDQEGRIKQQGPPSTIDHSEFEAPSSVPHVVTSPPELAESLHELLLPGGSDDPDMSRRTGDLKVYAYYARIIGWRTLGVYLLLCVAFIFAVNFSSFWVQWWTNANTIHPNERVGYWFGIYGVIAIAAIVGSLASECIFHLVIVPGSSNRFHELLLTTTKRATTAFLTSTDAGNIMNRFSQDLELIDNDLPASLDLTILHALSAVAEGIFVLIGSKYLAVGIPICIALIYIIQSYYLRTSRQLRLLDIEAKAPLFSHFLETLDGVTCIRAFGWTEEYIGKNFEILNESQKPYYLLWCIQRWLTLVLDLFVAGLAILLVATAMQAPTNYLGVALFSLVSFSSTLQQLVAEWTQLETGLGAVNRVRAFTLNTEAEDEGSKGEDEGNDTRNVPHDWPKDGSITFANVTASYDKSSEPVLKQVNFSVRPGQKVAICGRTGSGKTSLISAVLRMIELQTGQVLIDDVDISAIPREEVRKRLNTIPQGAFSLPGTLRDNLDPLHSLSGERIISVLRKLSLQGWLDANGGLDEELKEESLSHGQKQIFSLARAILRPGQIVIMDEVASSVDADSEKLIHRLIHEEFSGRTILAIAHRLDTVLDFDCVVILEKGRVAEIGNPRKLLATPESLFRRQYDSL